MRIGRAGIAILAVVTLGACIESSGPSTITSTTTTEATSTTTTLVSPTAPCISGELPFVSSGLVAALGEDEGDATTVRRVFLQRDTACERVTVEFTNANGAPAASIGTAGVRVLDASGAIRITLPGQVLTTALADSLLEGALVDRVYVAGDDTGMLIDVFPVDGVPVAVRAFATSSPVSVVVDVRENLDTVPHAGPSLSTTAVVTDPPPGPSLYPFTISGYASPGLDAIAVQISSEGEIIDDRAIALPGVTDTWQTFTIEIDDGPSGPISVYAGTIDVNRRPLAGATVSLDMP